MIRWFNLCSRGERSIFIFIFNMLTSILSARGGLFFGISLTVDVASVAIMLSNASVLVGGKLGK